MVVYYDRVRVGDIIGNWSPTINPPGSGPLVIGRRYNDFDGLYSTMEVDELTLWNN